MAESGDKTEEPTAKRLRDARERGQVAKSKEVVSAAGIITVMLLLWVGGDYFMGHFSELLAWPVWLESLPFEAGFNDMVKEVLMLGLLLTLPVVGVAALAGLLSNFFQVGVLFAPEAIKPDLKKLDPMAALKNIFSKKNAVEFLKSVAKILFMTYLVGHLLIVHLPTLLAIPYCGLHCIYPVLGEVLWDLVLYVSLAFTLVAAIDYVFQKYEYIKELKMTKDEVKREFKDSEGNPEIKGKRRQLFQEILNSQQTSNVKRSSMVISNPTHLAIGLYYQEEKTPLPIVTLKEEGLNALRVIAIAEREGIPVMRNVPLAHALQDQARVDNYIPSGLITPVAEVLRLVQELQGPA